LGAILEISARAARGIERATVQPQDHSSAAAVAIRRQDESLFS